MRHEPAMGCSWSQDPVRGPQRLAESVAVDLTAVRPMRPNQRMSDHPSGSPIRTAQEEFNRTYCGMLHRLDQAFNGSPQMLGAAIGMMYALKAQAQRLLEMPDGEGTTAGPTFEYVAPEVRG
ncbi:hypothetical protein [Streptomyces sp. TLI_185]|uniref:hypothetical protein n=1 Tax=Streptomyces sp. TLI_185 TaxID=2485151 RepID=UPI00161F7A78|nr:hypothetical protein [Streptomyces sp. TLI_185]